MSQTYKSVALVGVSAFYSTFMKVNSHFHRPVATSAKIILDGLIISHQFSITVLSRKESETTFPSRGFCL